MSDKLTEMDKIVEYLKTKKGMTTLQIEEYLRQVREAEERGKNKKEDPKYVLNDRAATVVFPHGFSVSFDMGGDIRWAYDGKKIDEDTAVPILSQHDLEVCFKHVVNNIIAHGAKKQTEVWKMMMQYKDAAEQVKTRYTNKNAKKAFVAGMILGKKETK